MFLPEEKQLLCFQHYNLILKVFFFIAFIYCVCGACEAGGQSVLSIHCKDPGLKADCQAINKLLFPPSHMASATCVCMFAYVSGRMVCVSVNRSVVCECE